MNKKMNLFSGISYAVGSIIGSGILFLPSMTYQMSGNDVLVVWGLATLLCIPLLIMFYDMSQVSNSDDGIKGFIEWGLGKNLAFCLPFLMLSTVSIGMPSSAIIVGKFVKDYSGFANIDYAVAFYLLAFGLISNIAGAKFGNKIQNIVSFLFFVVGILVFCLTFNKASGRYIELAPSFEFRGIFSGMTMAFWAFAGFENLTFMIKDFENPKRDFLLSMIVALAVCGVLYLGITANFSAIIPINKVQTVTGLFQLSQEIEPRNISGFVIVALAFFALKTNFNSWIRGLSSMIKSSALSGDMPALLAKGNHAIYLLGGLFSFSLVVSMIYPSFLKVGLVIVSSNFVVIYVLCTLSYLLKIKSKPKFAMGFVTFIFLISSLFTSGLKLLYPFAVILLCYLFFKTKRSRLSMSPIIFICLLIPISSFASPRELNVALIFRHGDKFNETTHSLNDGFELAKSEYEKSKKIKINFKRYDHNETLQSVVEATQKAILDGNVIIVGGENSDEALMIGEIIKGKDIVLITPTSTNPRVTQNRADIFRICISDDKAALKLADFTFKKLKSKAIGVLQNTSYPYSDYLSKVFLNRVNELADSSVTSSSSRIKISAKQIVRNQKDFSREIEFFKKQNITHLAILSFQSDLLRFYSQAAVQNYFPIYIGSDGWGVAEALQKNIKSAPDSVQKFTGFRNAYWYEGSKTEKNEKFKKQYLAKFNYKPDPWGAIAYDTITVLVEASSSIRDRITGIKIQEALKNLRSKNLVTTDQFSFDQNNTPSPDVFIYQIDANKNEFYEKI